MTKEMLISGLVGSIISLVIGAIFGEWIRTTIKRMVKWIKIKIYHPHPLLIDPETLTLGNRNTSWLIIDGNGEMTYSPTTIKCIVNNIPVPLPPDVSDLRSKIEQREAEKKAQGLNYQWNGPSYALERYAIGRTIPDEHMEVTFTFRTTDYFTFQATVKNLDANLIEPPARITIREKYLQGHSPSEPIPFLANGFGVTLAVLTKDRKLILSRRDDSVGVRAGAFDTTVVEGVHPNLDRASNTPGPDLYRTAIRGAQEEAGIELLEENISFLGFGVDMEYYQWNMIGIARVSETAERVLEIRRRGTGGKWETKKFNSIESDPRIVLTYLKQVKIWSCGLATIYFALINEYGKQKVDSAVREIFQ